MSLLRSLITAVALVLPMAAHADRVTVFAAASLKDAMDDIAPAFEAETGHEVVVSLAGSSALARQINEGAPAQVFISANSDWMDVLEANGKLAPESRRPLLGNRLVLVAHDPEVPERDITRDFDIGALLGDGQLAMALVEAVPAGIYGKAALESLGVWEALVPRVAQADNVRAALALVATGEAPLGIVYATDAMAEPKVHVVGRFPADSHPPIVYPAAAMADPGEAALAFLQFLGGEEAAAIFISKGFEVLEE
ncbi:molybdate ABC transporter substrate-binding protein [Pseudooceanicola sp. LIPI14-2-Ac024]|uniref:molybdate ABC transporter substrate-binding protein n=1 Tax=Pseudooceanicola sp. LIPI14-2-Ac024 TaxID=3344875 RepID=UPI0035D0CDB0